MTNPKTFITFDPDGMKKVLVYWPQAERPIWLFWRSIAKLGGESNDAGILMRDKQKIEKLGKTTSFGFFAQNWF
jgi:hypothetical protein